MSFYDGVRVGDLKIEEPEVLCTNSTALGFSKGGIDFCDRQEFKEICRYF
jgi:hypothetical protein